MKVWVVVFNGAYESWVQAVCSSRDKAQALIEGSTSLQLSEIEEWEVDGRVREDGANWT